MTHMIGRIIEKSIVNSPKSIILLGPRQVGKSTLIRSLDPHTTINLADEEVYVIVSFLMGSLSGKRLNEVVIYGSVMLVIIIIIYQYRNQLNIMMLGREEALITGVEYDKIFKIMVVLSSVLVALSVSLAGIIGFLGLVVPHIGRMFIGSDNKKSIIVIALIGAIFLLAADTITRAYLPNQVPVGVITTLIGGSFFVYLYNKRKV